MKPLSLTYTVLLVSHLIGLFLFFEPHERLEDGIILYLISISAIYVVVITRNITGNSNFNKNWKWLWNALVLLISLTHLFALYIINVLMNNGTTLSSFLSILNIAIVILATYFIGKKHYTPPLN